MAVTLVNNNGIFIFPSKNIPRNIFAAHNLSIAIQMFGRLKLVNGARKLAESVCLFVSPHSTPTAEVNIIWKMPFSNSVSFASEKDWFTMTACAKAPLYQPKN